MAKAKKKKVSKKTAKKKTAKKAASKKVAFVPKGCHTANVHLMFKDSRAAIAFYQRAFGAKLHGGIMAMGDKVAHAEIMIGDSVIMMSDEVEMPNSGKSPQTLGGHSAGVVLYVKDCDALFNRAVAAGAKAEQPPTDMFWGDRYSRLVDPFGHIWAVATHLQDLTLKQMQKGQEEFMAQMAKMAPMGQQAAS